MTDPATITSVNIDTENHRVVKASDSDPVLTQPGFFRVTGACAISIDCAPADLDDRLRFGVDPSPTITCLACLAAP